MYIDQKDVKFIIRALPEDNGPEGVFNSGNTDRQAKTCLRIRKEMEWNVWAWCIVQVKAQYMGLTAVEYLGACNYKSQSQFEEDYYYDQMKRLCIDSLCKQIEQIIIKHGGIRKDYEARLEREAYWSHQITTEA